MANELIVKGAVEVAVRDAREIALKINVIKEQTSCTVLMASVEIGRLLCEAKESVPHGEWGAWLSENVAYSVSTANNMMRLWREKDSMEQLSLFSSDSWDMFEGMSPTKVLALLDVPQGERREFIEKTGADSPEVSVSDVKAAIREKKEAEARAKAAEDKVAEMEREQEALSAQLADANVRMQLMEIAGGSPEEKARMEKEAADRANADAEKKIAAAKKKAEAALEKARKEGADAVKKVEAERDAAIERAREEARQAAQRESAAKIAALEERVKAQVVAASPHMERFKAHLSAFQDAYRRMLAVVQDAESEAPDVAAQLRRVVDELVKRLGPSGEGEGTPSADVVASSSTASGPPSPTWGRQGDCEDGQGGM